MQENGPEREDVKHALFAVLDAAARPDVVLASSSSGLLPSVIARGCPRHPERVLVGHPFNPPHLIPLVEVVPGEQTAEAAVERGDGVLRRGREAPDPAAPGAARARRQPAAGRAVAGGVLPGRAGRRHASPTSTPRSPTAPGCAGRCSGRSSTSTCPAGRAGSRTSSSTSGRPPRRGGATCGQVTLTPELVAKLVAGRGRRARRHRPGRARRPPRRRPDRPARRQGPDRTVGSTAWTSTPWTRSTCTCTSSRTATAASPSTRSCSTPRPKYFRADQDRTPTWPTIAEHYRARRTAAVVFTVDAARRHRAPAAVQRGDRRPGRRARGRAHPVRLGRPARGQGRRRPGPPAGHRARRARVQVPPQPAGLRAQRPALLPALRGAAGARRARAVPHRADRHRRRAARRPRDQAALLRADAARRRRRRLPAPDDRPGAPVGARGRTRPSPSPRTRPTSTSTCPAGRRSTSRPSSSAPPTGCSSARCCSAPTSRSSPPTAGSPTSPQLDIKDEVRPLILKDNAARVLGLG